MTVWLPATVAGVLVLVSGGALLDPHHGERAAIGTPPGWLLGLGFAGAGVVFGSPLLILGGPVVVAIGTRVVVSRRSRALAAASDAILGEFVAAVGRGLRSGWPLARAIDHAVDEQWADLRRSLQSGGRLANVLGSAPADNEDQRLVFDTLALLVERGGSSLATVERLGGVLDARAVARDEARSRTAQAKASAWLVSGLPLAFAAVIALVDSDAMTFFVATWLGAGCLVGSVGFSAAGWFWMQHLTEEALR